MQIIKDRDLINEDGSIPIKLLVKCISEHRTIVDARYKILEEYYDGQHRILNLLL